MSKVIAVTWFYHRRIAGLCAGLGLELHTLASRHRGVVRYLSLVPRTIWLLATSRPEVLLIQNPSLALAVLAAALRPLLRYRLVVDAHNEAVEPFINRSRWARWITNELLRRADFTIVSNRWLAPAVEAAGGRPFFLHAAVPEVRVPVVHGDGADPDNSHLPCVVVIATYAPDEPIQAMLEAARQLIGEVEFVFTGDSGKLPTSIRNQRPANV